MSQGSALPTLGDAALDEERLVNLAASGDAEAFRRLYLAHATWLIRFVSRRAPRSDAEDIVAETFIRAWQALPRYECRGTPLRAWLTRIASRLLADRARRLRPEHATAEPAPPPTPDFSDAVADVLTMRADLAELLAHLSDQQRAVLLLRYLDGLDTHETAAVMGISVEAVRACSLRATKTLRGLVKSHANTTLDRYSKDYEWASHATSDQRL